jgi:hypothetical protein
MLDGNATGFDREASHTTLEHRVVGRGNAQDSQHSLNELRLGEEALVSSQVALHRPTSASEVRQSGCTFPGAEGQISIPWNPCVGTSSASIRRSYTTLQLCVVLAEADAQYSQHSLNELLLGGEHLTPISSQLSYIAQQTHQTSAPAAMR